MYGTILPITYEMKESDRNKAGAPAPAVEGGIAWRVDGWHFSQPAPTSPRSPTGA
jgi:hypothetical protein